MSDQDSNNTPQRDDVGRLVQLAGRVSDVPAERAARVRAATRVHWKREVGKRRRQRVFWSVAAAAAAIAGIALVLRSIPGEENVPAARTVAHVEHVEGPVRTAGLDRRGWSTLWGGAPLEAATVLRTETGRVSLRLETGHYARIDRDSEVRLLDAGGLELAAGRIYLDSGPQGRATPIDLVTPYGTVREIGTQYEAQLVDSILRLRLREGSVALSRQGGDLTVDTGEELLVAPDGEPTISLIDSYGPHWDWVTELVSMPDFRGRAADDFLRWLARERGWDLEYADAAAETAARGAVLEGDLARYTPTEALEIVTATSRLTPLLEAGVLRVAVEP